MKVDELKARADELGIEYPVKITKPDLEQLIADKEASANAIKAESKEESKTETNGEQEIEATVAPIEDEAKIDEDKATTNADAPTIGNLNVHGFEVGKPVESKELFKHLSKERAKK